MVTPWTWARVERAGQGACRLGAGGGVGDHLGQHGVVVRPRPPTRPRRRCRRARPATAGNRKRCRWPGRGLASPGGVLGVEPGLDGVAGDGRRSRTSGGSGHALGHEELQPHEVEAGDELGDGVLDLEAGVDLQEGEAPVGQEEELDGAGVDVADGAGRGDRRGAELGAQRRGRRRGRGSPR